MPIEDLKRLHATLTDVIEAARQASKAPPGAAGAE
jgi:hypothetical protein